MKKTFYRFAFALATTVMGTTAFSTQLQPPIMEVIEIDASENKVWEVLVDFQRYHEWNKWITELRGKAVEGETVRAKVHVGKNQISTKHLITKVKAPFQLCWEDRTRFTFFVSGWRCRTLVPLYKNKVKLINLFEFAGPFSATENRFFRAHIQAGMKAENESLKNFLGAAHN